MVSLPQSFVASPSAVRNHRLACQQACHSDSVSSTSAWARRWRSLASLWPPRHTEYASGTQPVLNSGQLGFQMLQPPLLGVSLRLGCVPVDTALLAPNRNCKPRADGASGATQPNLVVGQVDESPLPLVIGYAGYCSCPTARGLACRCALPHRPLVVAPSLPTSPGKIMAGETTEMGAHCPKHGFVGGG
jgi:hypothetical protein